MELVTADDGNAAPRLNDLNLTPEQALEYHRFLISQVVLMLCAGVVHGDLSEYNVLVGSDGPVIIDLPQAVNAAGNNHARSMLERDVDNLANYFGQFAPALRSSEYGKEIWAIYERGELKPDVELTGHFQHDDKPADLVSVMREIEDAGTEEAAARLRRQEAQQRP